MARYKGREAIYQIAEEFRQRCLGQDHSSTSLLWPERRIWNIQNLETLKAAFIDNPNEGSGSFYEKWEIQLARESTDIHRLAADLIAFYSCFLVTLTLQQNYFIWRKLLLGNYPNTTHQITTLYPQHLNLEGWAVQGNII